MTKNKTAEDYWFKFSNRGKITEANFKQAIRECQNDVSNDLPRWYTENEMYQWLISHNYSEEISKDLSRKWADDQQGAFNKGYQKAKRDAAKEVAEHKAVIGQLLKYMADVSEMLSETHLQEYKQEIEASSNRARKLINL